MTPKQKAKELVNKMYGSDINDFESLKNNHPEDFQLSKDCSLIAVDEIIKSKQEDSSYCDEDGEWHNFMDFWQEVIEEIEKL
jgi:hypothetical protein